MTRGMIITIDQKKSFIEALKTANGNVTEACKICEIDTSTIKDLIEFYPDRDPSFTTACKTIINSRVDRIKDLTFASLDANLEKHNPIVTIFASKAFLGYTEEGKIDPEKERKQENAFPIEALKPETLRMIQKDVEEWKKLRGIDTNNVQDAEVVEYDGEDVNESLTIYEPESKHRQKRRSKLPNGGKRERLR